MRHRRSRRRRLAAVHARTSVRFAGARTQTPPTVTLATHAPLLWPSDWFRKALRVHDNPSLLAARDAAVAAGVPLLCVFVLDPWCDR